MMSSRRIPLPSDLQSAGMARDLIPEICPGQTTDVIETLRLAVSELVANAVIHGRPEIELVLEVGVDCIRIEVCDGERITPRQVRASPTALGGRGLLIVDALASQWGVTRLPAGKSVWCEIPLATTVLGAGQ